MDVTFYGVSLRSRLMLGTAQYPSPRVLAEAVQASGAEVVTVSLRREGRGGAGFREWLAGLGRRILPNTAGCHGVREAVTTAQMAREVFGTSWIKLEVIGHADSLQPDPFALVEAARILAGEGFEVFPYTTEDLVVAERLLAVGCKVLMPWAAPIGSGQGLRNRDGLRALRVQFPEVPMVIDAGIGSPSQAAQAMESGFDAVLLNSAVALARDPVAMTRAFALAVEAGHAGYRAGPMPPRDMAQASTPIFGMGMLG